MSSDFVRKRRNLQKQLQQAASHVKSQEDVLDAQFTKMKEAHTDFLSAKDLPHTTAKDIESRQKAEHAAVLRVQQAQLAVLEAGRQVYKATSSLVDVCTSIEELFGNTLEELLMFKSKVDFFSSFHHHVTMFMFRAFKQLKEDNPDLSKEYSSFHAHFLPALKDEAVNLDEDPAAPTPVTLAWFATLQKLGFSKDEWLTLPYVNGDDDALSHDAIDVNDGLALLRSTAALPEGAEPCRGPLIKLLEKLSP